MNRIEKIKAAINKLNISFKNGYGEKMPAIWEVCGFKVTKEEMQQIFQEIDWDLTLKKNGLR